jgi:hypothetical protein
MNATIKMIKDAQRIFKEQATLRICRTVDVYPELSATDRMTLMMSERSKVKYLCQTNKK